MGYIEETGAAQHLRDARIAPIYEGTNGIQANDLVGRKLGRDGGEAAREFFAEIRASLAGLPHAGELAEALAALEDATGYLVGATPACAAAGSAAYLALFGTVAGGWLLARVAAASGANAAKAAMAQVYTEHYLARAASYLPAVKGGATIVDFDPDLL